MTPETKAAILKQCEFNPCEYKGVKLGEQIYGHHENTRLLPIITELLSIIEAQSATLEQLQNIKDDDFVKTETNDGEIEFWVNDIQVQDIVETSLTDTTARLERLGGGE